MLKNSVTRGAAIRRSWAVALAALIFQTVASSAETLRLPQVDESVFTPEELADIAPPPPDEEPMLDRTHRRLHALLWRSAMKVDGWFGSDTPELAYADATRGSITPVVLWDEFNGFDQKFRFRVNLPLPHLDERYNAFVGTFSRDEFITERDQASGAIPRQRSGGRVEEDETLVGIQFREREGRLRFDADAGVRIRSPIDPFVKGGFQYSLGLTEFVVLRFEESAFWQNSEGFGVTSRVDLERPISPDGLIRWTASGTISQESEGVRGYSALTIYRGISSQSAIAGQLFTSGEFDAAVPLGEYGIRAAYRRRILRDWLVLEVRPSLTWPKDEPNQRRSASWGLGIGFEMFFGHDDFQTRPATF